VPGTRGSGGSVLSPRTSAPHEHRVELPLGWMEGAAPGNPRRGSNRTMTGTAPASAWSRRTMSICGSNELEMSTTIPSVTRRGPDSVVQIVSTTADPGRYRWNDVRLASGRMEKDPPEPGSMRRPKTGAESNRGAHSQSIEPSCEHSAAARP